MPVNPYLQSGIPIGRQSEQRLAENLIIEIIQATGHSLYYIPRTVVKHDRLFGEDVLSQYKNAVEIEMYLENTEGWDGDKDMFTKFGIQIKDKATFLVAKRRWEDTINTTGVGVQLPTRPAEGDLLYFPLTDSLFEIQFVKADDPFFQLGKFYVYTLECELFQYSAETIDTGIPEIDDSFGPPADFMSMNPLADNQQIQEEAEDILDFSVINPFGEL